MSQHSSRKFAFTLIELLIVITIIGILAVALGSRLLGAPGRARDAQRKSDMQQIATALEFYANDNNGNYPADVGGTNDNCVSGLSLSGYITPVPTDPSVQAYETALTRSCTGGAYTYVAVNGDTDGNVEGYMLIAHLENDQDRSQGVYAANGFDIPAYSSSSSMGTTASILDNTANSARSCYEGGTSCTSTTTDVLFVIGR